jgi:hypothetical protein
MQRIKKSGSSISMMNITATLQDEHHNSFLVLPLCISLPFFAYYVCHVVVSHFRTSFSVAVCVKAAVNREREKEDRQKSSEAIIVR